MIEIGGGAGFEMGTYFGGGGNFKVGCGQMDGDMEGEFFIADDGVDIYCRGRCCCSRLSVGSLLFHARNMIRIVQSILKRKTLHLRLIRPSMTDPRHQLVDMAELDLALCIQLQDAILLYA